MSKTNSYLKLQPKIRKELHFAPNVFKKLNNSTNQKNNEKEDSVTNIPAKEKKHFLLLKKINLKENKNSKYSNALKNIFQKPEYF